ncbi:hypothetical protein SAMN04324257_01337 [Thermoanaerobacter thermohydrosulfuricus]|nr:hypothetical protein SAMN04324257_01337 [Thermoanaerobacter thermohydrosulfuricus]
MDLNKVTNNLYEFSMKFPEFFEELMSLVEKYEDWYYVNKGFSLRYRDLFRILSEREREPWVLPEEYKNMKQDVYSLKLKDPEAFDKFSLLIKKYVVREEHGIGYSRFVDCLHEAYEKFSNANNKTSVEEVLNNLNKSIEEIMNRLNKLIEEYENSNEG